MAKVSLDLDARLGPDHEWGGALLELLCLSSYYLLLLR